MEIKVARDVLSAGIGSVQNIVDRKTTMPILSNVLCEAKNNALHLSATDLEVGILNTIPCEVLSPGKITLPARGFYDIVKQLPNEKVTLIEMDNHWVTIHCAKSKFKLVGLDPKEFPTLPKKKEGTEFSLEVTTMLEMVAKTDFATSTDETRFNLNGILFESGEKSGKPVLRLVATDGHRLSLSEKEVTKKAPFSKGVLFPRKGVAEIRRLLEGSEGDVNIWIGETQAIIDKGEKRLIVRLIDGQFPPYQHVIPKKQDRIVSLPRKELVESLRRVSVVTTDRSRGVSFSFSPGNLEIQAKNPDLGEAKEELSVQYKGPTFQVGFNALYFLECLNVLEDEQVVLQLKDEVSPCLIQSEKDSGFTHVIMPMRI